MNHLKLIIAGVLLFVVGCGGGESNKASTNSSNTQAKTGSELTAFQLEHGIGPVTEVIEIGELDPNTVKKGEESFVQYCSACHKVSERYIGPAMIDAAERRTPTYLMNMIMNPEEMTKRHPDARALLAEYLAPMPNQNLTAEEARAVVEFILSEAGK